MFYPLEHHKLWRRFYGKHSILTSDKVLDPFCIFLTLAAFRSGFKIVFEKGRLPWITIQLQFVPCKWRINSSYESLTWRSSFSKIVGCEILQCEVCKTSAELQSGWVFKGTPAADISIEKVGHFDIYTLHTFTHVTCAAHAKYGLR